MKQLEISFNNEASRIFATEKGTEKEKEVLAKPMMTRVEKLKVAAIGTKKMTSSLEVKAPAVPEWGVDPDVPGMEEIEK